MRATIMYAAGDVRVQNVADPTIVDASDAIVRVTSACICGSDLWPYADMTPSESGQSMGHEAIGVVDGRRRRRAHARARRPRRDAVRVLRRHLPVLPRRPAHCVRARRVLRQQRHQRRAGRGAAHPARRRHPVPAAGRRGPRADALAADALGRDGHRPPRRGRRGRQARRRGRRRRRRRGRPVRRHRRKAPRRGPDHLLGRHEDRTSLARELGATDVVSERGDEAVERVRELTGGFGVHAVLECVGTEASTQTSVEIARPGGAIGRVGVPHYPAIPLAQPLFYKNVKVGGGPAPVRAYIDELLPAILDGRIEPGRVFDRIVGLDGVPDGYRAMADRESIKVMVKP